MALCSGILKPSYFDPALKKSVKFLQTYFEQYKNVPKAVILKAETGLTLDDVDGLTKEDVKYLGKEIETFCQNRAITEAIIAGPELLSTGDFGKLLENLKTAISVGLQTDIGTNYFEDPQTRILKGLENEAKISTGIPELDDLIGGGIARQELLLFAANSGGGKSMNMLNLAKNFLSQGLHGVYISLEMSEFVVSKRLDSMITKIAQAKLLAEMNSVVNLLEKAGSTYGKFVVKRMPENRTNVSHVRSYLQQLEQSTGFKPDFIVIDYIDIMGSVSQVTSDNMFVKDKNVTEEVRSLGFDYNAIILSASQLGRQAIESDRLNQAHIQGGISKINTSDYTIGIKMDDLMKSAGEIYYECLKSRNSENAGKRALLKWDPISLTVSSLKNKQTELVLNKKSDQVILPTASKNKTNSILGLMNT